MTRQETETVDLGVGVRQSTLLDADSIVEDAVKQALAYCAQKMGLGSGQAVREQLQRENIAACKYCYYSIARQVGDLLGTLDQNVEAVYILDYDATPQDLCYTGDGQTTLIHLIVRVKRKTNALGSVVEVLNQALVRAYAKLLDRQRLEHLLDVQVVDGVDVAKRIGYGAMLSSLHNRPIQVWERSS
jgi:hypothetical protein